MAKFSLKCSCCGYVLPLLRPRRQDTQGHTCPKCSESPMELLPGAPTTRIVESLDNGLMPRAIERPAESERLFKERAEADNRRVAADIAGKPQE